MIKQIKVGVIVGVIVFLVTFTCDWLRDYAKQKKSDRTIHILTDSVFTYKKKLNDTTEVFVTQTRQYSQDIAMARRENKALRSTIMNDVRSRNIQTASNMIVEVNNSDKVIQAYKDSVGIYK